MHEVSYMASFWIWRSSFHHLLTSPSITKFSEYCQWKKFAPYFFLIPEYQIRDLDMFWQWCISPELTDVLFTRVQIYIIYSYFRFYFLSLRRTKIPHAVWISECCQCSSKVCLLLSTIEIKVSFPSKFIFKSLSLAVYYRNEYFLYHIFFS